MAVSLGLVVLLPVKASPEAVRAYEDIVRPLAGGHEFTVVALEEGLEQIETAYDDARTAPLVARKVVELWRSGAEGVLINCFDDPGLEAARELVPIPVVGAGQAAMHAASLVADRFAVVTVGGAGSERVIWWRARLYGVESKLAAVQSIEAHVLDIGREPGRIVEAVVEASRRLVREHGIDAIVLGCTGFSPYADAIAKRLKGVAVVDPTRWGFLLLRSWVDAGTPNPFHRAGGV